MSYKNLTAEQKIGRVLCARLVKGSEADLDFTLKLLKAGACSCVQVRIDKNAPEIIKKLRAAADYPILIINDMETGFPLAGRSSVPQLSLAACDDPELTRAFAATVASDAKKAGFSGCWGPVVDILHGDGPCSVYRKAGDTPEGVLKLTEEIARVYDSYRFHSTAKHYPGCAHPIDTHMAEGTSPLTKEELLSFDLVPYLELMKKGLLRSIMTMHTVYTNIDPERPASLSKKVIDIIREQGFDGVIYTDSLAMMGILQKFGEAEAMAMALMAGNDIVLPNYRTSTEAVYEMMLDCYRRGLISDERLDEACRRIDALCEYCAEEPENPYPIPENIDEVLSSVPKNSITAKCAEGMSHTIDANEPHLFIVVTDSFKSDVTEEIYELSWYSPYRVRKAILERFPKSEVVFIPEFASAQDNDRVLRAAIPYDNVVFVSYCDTTSYLGTDCLTRRCEMLIKCLNISGKCKTLVHFGNPLAIEDIDGMDRKIYGYRSPDTQKYAFDVLSGALEPKGKNPFPRLCKSIK